MLYIDTRERGSLHKQLASELEHEYKALDAGDFIIPKHDGGFIVIERSSYTDFAGKIMSGRLWKQVEKCTTISDDVYFILENPYLLKHTKMSLASIYGAIISVSRKCNIITTRSASETKIVILRLHQKYGTNIKIESDMMRVKLKNPSVKEITQYMLMGIPKVGSKSAEILSAYSIAELCNMELKEISNMVSKSIADSVYQALH